MVTPEVTPDGLIGLVTGGGGPIGGSVASLAVGIVTLVLVTIGAAALAGASLRRRRPGPGAQLDAPTGGPA